MSKNADVEDVFAGAEEWWISDVAELWICRDIGSPLCIGSIVSPESYFEATRQKSILALYEKRESIH